MVNQDSEKTVLSFEISTKRSAAHDPISQEAVENCIRIATEAHRGQRDRDNNAVILHPLILGSMGKTDEEKCVGFLHDVVEDTDWTFDDLIREGVPEAVVEALRANCFAIFIKLTIFSFIRPMFSNACVL